MNQTELGMIDLKGPLPKPYMFEAAEFDPPVELQVQRMYHVGLNRYFGPVKRWHYGKRGWLRGHYYVKPERSAWLEWVHCMVSPAHARATWLRIMPEAEEHAIVIAKRVVIGLFVAVAFIAGMIVGELRVIHYINQHQQMQQIELRSA